MADPISTTASNELARLNGPEPSRIDEALGAEVGERLLAWAVGLGMSSDDLARYRRAGLGRLAMLMYVETADPDRLMLAARFMLAVFVADDLFCDDQSRGSVSEKVAARLALCLSAGDRPSLHDPYGARFDRVVTGNPAFALWRDSLARIASAATASQLARFRGELANLFLGMAAEASWRLTGETPAVWEYLTIRRLNSFAPCVALIDVLGGYVLDHESYNDPRVRRATELASLAGTIVNDLYSLANDARPTTPGFNLPTMIAAEQGCSLSSAIEQSVSYHDEIVRELDVTHRQLSAGVKDRQLDRYLSALWSWMAGAREWHKRSRRYHGDASIATTEGD